MTVKAEAQDQSSGNDFILNKQDILTQQSWWDNKDWGWYKDNIPFFESPETLIDATYYYRWEVMTKHLTYGSPETGYTFTEFMDRPNWSGTYGSISCPLGHQFSEVRWLKNRRIINDFANYWFETEGAEPRSYTNWYASSMWNIYKVWLNKDFVKRVYPHMQAQYKGWLDEHYDSEHKMFMWDGMHDGMESNINSRQTKNWFSGGDGYRPTINSYLYGDLKALSDAAALLGKPQKSKEYENKADTLKKRVQDELWDARREFFFHQWSQDKLGARVKEGTFRERMAKDSIKKYSLTYETGPYAGNEHGRELIGYVPWQFNLPDSSYSAAWKFLMDTDYFWTEYGPPNTEQLDPLYYVSPRCCVWSGNSWPFANSQTLEAMANLLNNYEQPYVDKEDYVKFLRTFSRTQRWNGHPYVAEVANPYTGSWDGANHYYHSEHYLHSQYINLIITGLSGLRPQADNSIVVNPLIPDTWDYFALDDVAYHGHSVSIVWDKDGNKYHKGKGLMVFVDGQKVDSSATVQRLRVEIPEADGYTTLSREHNFAVNNEKQFYPHLYTSYSNPKHPAYYAIDGNYWYHELPDNRWTTEGSTSKKEWAILDFGIQRSISRIELYFLDDNRGVEVPATYEVTYWDGQEWQGILNSQREYPRAVGHRSNTVAFDNIKTSKIRVQMIPRQGAVVGLTEIEAWGDAPLPLEQPESPIPNLAYAAEDSKYPRITASYTFQNDQLSEINDMEIVLLSRSSNRWTAFKSPNKSDWVQVDFGEDKEVARLDLYLYGDGNGVKAPKSYRIEYFNNGQWSSVIRKNTIPEDPQAMAKNTVTIETVKTSKVRVHFEHADDAFTGVSELMIWGTSPVQ